MELTGHKKVHIIPMGFEIDRIELPLRKIGVDRVHLITDETESETGILYQKELTRRLQELVREYELKISGCPMWDFRKLMALLCELVRKENNAGNFVYINISSGSKLSAIAGTLASLMYGGTTCRLKSTTSNIQISKERLKGLQAVFTGY